jgi:hypothetical protein
VQRDGELLMSQEKFVNDVEYRPAFPRSTPPTQKLNPKEHTGYRSGTGALLWALKTRMDFASKVSELKRADASPTVADHKALNKVISEMRCTAKQCLHFRRFPAGCSRKWRLILFTDASFNKREDEKSFSQLGYIICLAEDRHDTLDGIVHVLDWASKRAQRVCKSTFKAEILGATAGYEEAIKIARWVHEMESDVMDSRDPTARLLRDLADSGSPYCPVDALTDAKSVYDSLYSTKEATPTDKDCILYIRWLREQLAAGTIRGLGWVCTHDMLADVLTKGTIDPKQIRMAANGYISLKYSYLMNGTAMCVAKGLPPAKRNKPDDPVGIAFLMNVPTPFFTVYNDDE